MTEREKVIDYLEYHIHLLYDVIPHVSRDDGEYLEAAAKTMSDALILLKAQEPVEPIRKPEIFDSLYFCGKCSAKVGFQMRKDDSWRFKYKFCPDCGRAVKWG